MNVKFFKDDAGYHELPDTDVTKLNANVLDFSNRSNPGVIKRDVQPITEVERIRIAKENEEISKKPVIKLEKTTYNSEQKIEILEREKNLVFLKVTELLRNPDGTIPQVNYSKRKLGQVYWIVGRITVTQSMLLDAFDMPLGILSQKKETLKFNPSVELQKLNDKGMPYGELGFNAQKDLVYGQYLQTKIKDRAEESAALVRIADEALRVAQVEKVSAIRIELKPQLGILFTQIKETVLVSKDPLKDPKVIELVNRYNRIETILKSLTK
jgi:hypothetical protein